LLNLYAPPSSPKGQFSSTRHFDRSALLLLASTHCWNVQFPASAALNNWAIGSTPLLLLAPFSAWMAGLFLLLLLLLLLLALPDSRSSLTEMYWAPSLLL
jgi:hypothetical protein